MEEIPQEKEILEEKPIEGNETEKVEAPEVKEEKVETPIPKKEISTDEKEFDLIKDAEEQMKVLQSYNKQGENNNYEYDEELGGWVDKDGKIFDKKPETVSEENTFDPYEWQLKEQENKIKQAKNNVVASKERECIEVFNKEFEDYSKILSQAQWEALKHYAIDSTMSEFADVIYNDKYNENTLKNVGENLNNSIETIKSIFNLNKIAEERLNTQKNVEYPLEGQKPTGVQGVVSDGTFEGKTRAQRETILDNIAKRLKNIL